MTVENKLEMTAKVQNAIEQIRPYLQADGGDIAFVELTDDLTVKVELQGAYAQNTWFQIQIATPSAGYVYIEVPAAVIESDDYSITGAANVTNRAFTIKGLGGRCSTTTTLPPCIISNYAGALP